MPISRKIKASDEMLAWMHKELVRCTFDPGLIFSIEKILQFKVLLHIRANGEVYAQWMHHGGRLSKKKPLQDNGEEITN